MMFRNQFLVLMVAIFTTIGIRTAHAQGEKPTERQGWPYEAGVASSAPETWQVTATVSQTMTRAVSESARFSEEVARLEEGLGPLIEAVKVNPTPQNRGRLLDSAAAVLTAVLREGGALLTTRDVLLGSLRQGTGQMQQAADKAMATAESQEKLAREKQLRVKELERKLDDLRLRYQETGQPSQDLFFETQTTEIALTAAKEECSLVKQQAAFCADVASQAHGDSSTLKTAEAALGNQFATLELQRAQYSGLATQLAMLRDTQKAWEKAIETRNRVGTFLDRAQQWMANARKGPGFIGSVLTALRFKTTLEPLPGLTLGNDEGERRKYLDKILGAGRKPQVPADGPVAPTGQTALHEELP